MDNPLNPEVMKMAAQLYATFYATLYQALLDEGFTDAAAHKAALDLFRLHLQASSAVPPTTEGALDSRLKDLAALLTKGGSA